VAQIDVLPPALAFGDVEVGANLIQTVTIRNLGTADLTVSELVVTGADFVLGNAPDLPVVIVPNASVPVGVMYQPTVPGASAGSLTIRSNVLDTPLLTVDLSGTGQTVAMAQIDVLPAALAFGVVEMGTIQRQTVAIRNVVTTDLTVSNLTVTGGEFTLGQAPNLPAVIAPNDVVSVEVVYQPTAQGAVTGTLDIQSDAVNLTTATVDLSGTG
jgi:hypothetical protein